MKGKILDFTIQTNTGIILADNQQRYHFAGSEWKEQHAPVRGHQVDFEVNAEGQALAVYLEPVASTINPAQVTTAPSLSPIDAQPNSAKEMLNKLDQAESSYQQAILTCFKKFADFKGRARRSEFWYFELFCVLISLLLSFVNEELATLVMLITFIPNLAVSVRRLHDIGRSGWWMLIVAIPIVGILLLLFWATQEGHPEPNQYGVSPKA